MALAFPAVPVPGGPARSLALIVAAVVSLALLACSSKGGGSDATAPACVGAACPPVACTADERTDDSGACIPLGWRDCPTGFVLDPAGFGCTDVLPSAVATCAAGSMPVLGQTACAPVAAAACASGFARAKDGWGCQAVMPSIACIGATREALGQTTCAPVGDCAAAFPPAGATVFVDPAGAVDATHFHTIGGALAAAPAGATIAVQAGTYAESLVPTRAATLVGRCAAQVTLTSADGTTMALAVRSGVSLTVSGMSITGNTDAAIVDSASSLALTNVVIDANSAGGIIAAGASTHVTLDHSVVRGTTLGTGTGYGVEASAGATVTITESAIVGNTAIGVFVTGTGSRGHIEQSVIAGTLVDASGAFGIGVHVRNGAVGEVLGSSLSRNHEVGGLSYGPSASLTLTDSTIENTQNSNAGYGRGVIADGATVTLERVTVSGNTDVGVVAEDQGTANLMDSVVSNTNFASDGTNGIGVSALANATIHLTGSAVIGNHQAGAAALGALAAVTLESSLVAGTLVDSTGTRGFGLDLEMGGAATVNASALIGNTSAGVGAVDSPTKLTMSQSVVAGTVSDATKKAGRGLDIETGAAAAVTTSAIVGNHETGIDVRGAGATISVDQCIVRDTLPLESTGTHGRGIEVGSGGAATLARTSVLRSHGGAVVALDAGSSIDMQNAWIADTLADASTGGPGRALSAQSGATLTMLGVVAQRSIQVGIVVTAGATLSMTSSRLEDVTAGDDAASFGDGVVVGVDSSAVLADVTVRRCASVGLLFDASSGVVTASSVTDNAIGIAVQDGTALQQLDTPPATPSEGVVAVSTNTAFTGNATLIGSGTIPIPDALQ